MHLKGTNGLIALINLPTIEFCPECTGDQISRTSLLLFLFPGDYAATVYDPAAAAAAAGADAGGATNI